MPAWGRKRAARRTHQHSLRWLPPPGFSRAATPCPRSCLGGCGRAVPLAGLRPKAPGRRPAPTPPPRHPTRFGKRIHITPRSVGRLPNPRTPPPGASLGAPPCPQATPRKRGSLRAPLPGSWQPRRFHPGAVRAPTCSNFTNSPNPLPNNPPQPFSIPRNPLHSSTHFPPIPSRSRCSSNGAAHGAAARRPTHCRNSPSPSAAAHARRHHRSR